jgi:hypothetical protein
MTKALKVDSFCKLREGLGMCDLANLMWFSCNVCNTLYFLFCFVCLVVLLIYLSKRSTLREGLLGLSLLLGP